MENKGISIQDAVNHMAFLLNDTEKIGLEKMLNQLINEKNHFWSYSFIDFYYGSLSSCRGYGDQSDLNKDRYYFIKVKLGSPYKDGEPKGYIEELLPIPDLNLQIGTLISDRSLFKHKESHKYATTKPPYKIIAIDGDLMTMELEYVYRKKHINNKKFGAKKKLKLRFIDVNTILNTFKKMNLFIIKEIFLKVVL